MLQGGSRSGLAENPGDERFPVAVIIPAYRPNRSILDVVHGLVGRGIPAIFVVDDGSGPEFRPVFDELSSIPTVLVLRHAVNLGKGAALKTAMNRAMADDDGYLGVVTADADGQHHPDDIVGICGRAAANPTALVLGCRTFTSGIPLRSRIGNNATRTIMRIVLGRKLGDTQTGLRGIPRALILRLLKIPATGYEFELEMLIAAKHQDMSIVEQPIRTIYEPGNPTSHFEPLRDSMRIYLVLLRFSFISLITATIDNTVFYLVYRGTGAIAAAQVVARAVAVLFNYRAVRQAVFLSDEEHGVVLPRYLLLIGVNALVSYSGIRFLAENAPIGVVSAKLIIEGLLFLANFAIQRDFIFTRRKTADRSNAG